MNGLKGIPKVGETLNELDLSKINTLDQCLQSVTQKIKFSKKYDPKQVRTTDIVNFDD